MLVLILELLFDLHAFFEEMTGLPLGGNNSLFFSLNLHLFPGLCFCFWKTKK
jgi:hypothetical protein